MNPLAQLFTLTDELQLCSSDRVMWLRAWWQTHGILVATAAQRAAIQLKFDEVRELRPDDYEFQNAPTTVGSAWLPACNEVAAERIRTIDPISPECLNFPRGVVVAHSKVPNRTVQELLMPFGSCGVTRAVLIDRYLFSTKMLGIHPKATTSVIESPLARLIASAAKLVASPHQSQTIELHGPSRESEKGEIACVAEIDAFFRDFGDRSSIKVDRYVYKQYGQPIENKYDEFWGIVHDRYLALEPKLQLKQDAGFIAFQIGYGVEKITEGSLGWNHTVISRIDPIEFAEVWRRVKNITLNSASVSSPTKPRSLASSSASSVK